MPLKCLLSIIVSTTLFCFNYNVLAASLGARVSTLGVGLEYAHGLNDTLQARVGFNMLKISSSQRFDGNNYDLDINFESWGALLDYYPFQGRFRFTGGLLVNNNNFDLTLTAQENYSIGDTTYSGDLTINGSLGFRQFAPYLGFGWSANPSKASGWGYGFDVALVYQGEPKVTLNARGTATQQGTSNIINVADDPTFIEALVREEGNFQEDADGFVLYPVISFGLSYAF
ncbi:MAG: hypothetical protein GXP14_00645 [Gammaproteobacteria bacterium]|nr:hypothetical protein [Gammaproteobacteria bacterium]